jgi:hypothetical protein
VAATSAATPPTGMVAITALVVVSMTVTLFVLLLATNSFPPAMIMPSGPPPTGMVGPALCVRVSTGVTLLSL